MTYDNRVAVVTGAGSGIGRALTIALTREGARVAAFDISDRGLAETKAACGAGRVTAYQVDVADRESVFAHAEQVRADLGPASLLFNNAGVDLCATVEGTDLTDADWLIDINIGGVLNGTKAFLPQLIEAGAPERPARLVNLSSAFGLIAMPYQSIYSASKFAVRGFTEALRQELIIDGRPVTAHCVHPGVVKTNFGSSMRVAPGAADMAQMFDRIALTSADKAARVILRGVDKNRARILIGADGRVAAAVARVIGAPYIGLLARASRLSGARTDVVDPASSAH